MSDQLKPAEQQKYDAPAPPPPHAAIIPTSLQPPPIPNKYSGYVEQTSLPYSNPAMPNEVRAEMWKLQEQITTSAVTFFVLLGSAALVGSLALFFIAKSNTAVVVVMCVVAVALLIVCGRIDVRRQAKVARLKELERSKEKYEAGGFS